jgi:hypothetical protein
LAESDLGQEIEKPWFLGFAGGKVHCAVDLVKFSIVEADLASQFTGGI